MENLGEIIGISDIYIYTYVYIYICKEEKRPRNIWNALWPCGNQTWLFGKSPNRGFNGNLIYINIVDFPARHVWWPGGYSKGTILADTMFIHRIIGKLFSDFSIRLLLCELQFVTIPLGIVHLFETWWEVNLQLINVLEIVICWNWHNEINVFRYRYVASFCLNDFALNSWEICTQLTINSGKLEPINHVRIGWYWSLNVESKDVSVHCWMNWCWNSDSRHWIQWFREMFSTIITPIYGTTALVFNIFQLDVLGLSMMWHSEWCVGLSIPRLTLPLSSSGRAKVLASLVKRVSDVPMVLFHVFSVPMGSIQHK